MLNTLREIGFLRALAFALSGPLIGFCIFLIFNPWAVIIILLGPIGPLLIYRIGFVPSALTAVFLMLTQRLPKALSLLATVAFGALSTASWLAFPRGWRLTHNLTADTNMVWFMSIGAATAGVLWGLQQIPRR
ncbi:MAG: hypothetical protein K2W81_07965 [Sphingomonas sp.]|uniref:hypothetical protein n=1 Tax=Sphingomonas sp. TaxID=28214 RepID=UPI0025E52722|nr:hypothetical protein [Sphingomonas sp.]MBY0283885.1 hypothetical protein [Sphingomonas sp.]